MGVSNGDLGADRMWVGAGEKRACCFDGGLLICITHSLFDGVPQEAKVLTSKHLRQVLDSMGVKHFSRDKLEALEQRIVESACKGDNGHLHGGDAGKVEDGGGGGNVGGGEERPLGKSAQKRAADDNATDDNNRFKKNRSSGAAGRSGAGAEAGQEGEARIDLTEDSPDSQVKDTEEIDVVSPSSSLEY